MSVTCNNRWKTDARFVKFRIPNDEYGRGYIPFCTHPAHIGLIADPTYRFKECEKKGGGKFCRYYRRFRDEKEILSFQSKIEVVINQGTD